MADTLAHPAPGFAFKVTLQIKAMESNAALYFKSVGGLRYETETVPVQAGGSNDRTFNLIGATKWSNIVLKRGFSQGSALLALRDEWMFKSEKKRFSGTIEQLDTTLKTTLQAWTFHRGWPVKWELSDLDASKSEMSIETLEIAHDGLTLAR
jgi:phage tail-like protein